MSTEQIKVLHVFPKSESEIIAIVRIILSEATGIFTVFHVLRSCLFTSIKHTSNEQQVAQHRQWVSHFQIFLHHSSAPFPVG